MLSLLTAAPPVDDARVPDGDLKEVTHATKLDLTQVAGSYGAL
jgi:hypothetical protein